MGNDWYKNNVITSNVALTDDSRKTHEHRRPRDFVRQLTNNKSKQDMKAIKEETREFEQK